MTFPDEGYSDISPCELATGEPLRYDDPLAAAVEQDLRDTGMIPAKLPEWKDVPTPRPVLHEKRMELATLGGYDDKLSVHEDGSGQCWCHISTNGVSWGVFVDGTTEEAKRLCIPVLAERFAKAARVLALLIESEQSTVQF